MEATRTLDFIREMVLDDLRSDRHGGRVTTRFPPEPNGYLHIGHAKSICLNFGIPQDFKDQAPAEAHCNLRFDDTNPTKEEQEYIDAIKRDIHWLGFDWGEHEYYASDYFEQLYEWAIQLIKDGKAYVCDLTAEEIRKSRGTLTQPGAPSPHRDRSVEENLDLFERMRQGEFPDGTRVLRARIDMASPNLNMRDPVMYRILHAKHPRTGGAWCIYPMYDYAHGQSDSIERITHSLCTLEFEDHRPLYDWFIEQLGIYPSRQTEFNRLNLTHTVVTKRKLRTLVEDRHVAGWDDPRMPTLSALRRRGYPPAAIRAFCDAVGLSKREQLIDLSRLEYHVREELNRTANRVMAVLDPLRLVITNYPAGQVEQMEAVNNPEDESAGRRSVPFSQVLYIERDDFMENPPGKFFRLAPGREVRLRYGYWVTCTDVVKDDAGNITEVRCTYDPLTRGGDSPPDGRKVKGTIHWVSAAHALDAEVRLYDTLFSKEDPNDVPDGGDWLDNLNPDSLKIVRGAKVEPSLAGAKAGATFQFERLGYFCVDPDTEKSAGLVFNRTVTLKDSWGKAQKQS
ncbi:MAG: glutamine--tRNA ligase/YqeY domain fusion protein [Phycisphaerales bacterium]|nr:glutamine--tRNA ligase/YqeY domain fusion protein [Phycisphaerales bacterium]